MEVTGWPEVHYLIGWVNIFGNVWGWEAEAEGSGLGSGQMLEGLLVAGEVPGPLRSTAKVYFTNAHTVQKIG